MLKLLLIPMIFYAGWVANAEYRQAMTIEQVYKIQRGEIKAPEGLITLEAEIDAKKQFDASKKLESRGNARSDIDAMVAYLEKYPLPVMKGKMK